MKAGDQHLLHALQSFIDDDYISKNLDTLRDLERYLSMQLMAEQLDPDHYDQYVWLIQRLETMLRAVKVVEVTRQAFSDRNN